MNKLLLSILLYFAPKRTGQDDNCEFYIYVGRLQLMCYKYMWDNLATGAFPSRQFFDYFSLNPDHVLSEEIRESTADAGYPAKVNVIFSF